MHERIEREKQEPEPTEPFRCEICGREFPYLQSIKIHMGRHKSNQENSLEEYLEKKAIRQAASKERYRQNAKVYKIKYKEMQLQKSRILKELGIEPDNPIAKTIDFKGILKNWDRVCQEEGEQETNAFTSDTPSTSLQSHQPVVVDDIVEVEADVVDNDVVIDTAQLIAAKAAEYVVSGGAHSTDTQIVVEQGEEVTEINMENLDSSAEFTILNFITKNKSDEQ